jgi:hypothetical protein
MKNEGVGVFSLLLHPHPHKKLFNSPIFEGVAVNVDECGVRITAEKVR